MADLLGNTNKKEPVVIARGIYHIGAMHGMITGGGTLQSKDKVYGLRLTPTSDKFGGWEIITYGINDYVPFQRYDRPKVIHVKDTTPKKIIVKEVQKDIKQEELI